MAIDANPKALLAFIEIRITMKYETHFTPADFHMLVNKYTVYFIF